MTDHDWRPRFRAPLIWEATLAARNPDRGLVVSSQDGRTIQLYGWDVRSGKLTALTSTPDGVVEGWIDPLGEYVFHLRDDGGSEHGHLVRVPFGGGPAVDVTPELTPYTLRGMGISASGRVLTFNPVNEDGFAVYAVDLHPDGRVGEPRLLHRDAAEVWGALPSARGDLAACWSTARAGGTRHHTLLVFDTATGDLVGELDDGPDASVVGVAFSPVDGDDRLLATTTRSGFTRPVVWNPRTGVREDVPVADVRGDVRPLCWSPDAERLLLCRVAGAQRLDVLDLPTGRIVALDHPPGTYYSELESTLSFGPGGDTLIGRRTTSTAPPDVVELDATTGRELRVLLRSEAPAASQWRSVIFPSSDGTEVQAWVATPDGPGPFPTILETHGGPHFAATERYDPGAQCWVDNGFAWMSVNYRGSTTFGREFAERIWGDMGRWELADMIAGRSWLVDAGVARPDEIFVHGASYGGYLTLFALGKRPDLWAGGIALVADADLTACYAEVSPAIRAALTCWMQGTPDERPEAYAASSPITYVADVAAPVLVIQGRNDTRTPPRQIEEYERRMREHGKDIEVVWFDAGHQSIGPDLLIPFYEAMIAFANRVLDQRREPA